MDALDDKDEWTDLTDEYIQQYMDEVFLPTAQTLDAVRRHFEMINGTI